MAFNQLNSQLRYLSLFSGIEAASAAWESLGWSPVAFSEIERFPSEVLKTHFPGVQNLGDITQISERQISSLGPIDIVVGGSPCQDLSIAGKRDGLNGAKSQLFFEQIRIFHEARKHNGARFLLWENVHGTLSSHKGKDFARVVEEMAGLYGVVVPPHGWGGQGAALGDNGMLQWRVLDAQWFGVAQRRRRLFCLLDTGDWASTAPILLEPEGMSGNPPSRG